MLTIYCDLLKINSTEFVKLRKSALDSTNIQPGHKGGSFQVSGSNYLHTA